MYLRILRAIVDLSTFRNLLVCDYTIMRLHDYTIAVHKSLIASLQHKTLHVASTGFRDDAHPCGCESQPRR